MDDSYVPYFAVPVIGWLIVGVAAVMLFFVPQVEARRLAGERTQLFRAIYWLEVFACLCVAVMGFSVVYTIQAGFFAGAGVGFGALGIANWLGRRSRSR